MSSCVVSTAAKVVKTTAKIGVSAVKGTVKGISWTVKKANGKINENRLDGSWKIVGVYNGTYEQFSKDDNPESKFVSSCEMDMNRLFLMQSERDSNLYTVVQIRSLGQNIHINSADIQNPKPKKITSNTMERII